MIISPVTTKISIFFFNCEIELEFDNNYIANIEIDYHYNNGTKNIKLYFTLFS